MNRKTLFQRCIEVCSQKKPKDLKDLPPFLREKILFFLVKRSKCTPAYLEVLLHKHLTRLDLTFCVMREFHLELTHKLPHLKYISLPHPHILIQGEYSEYSERAILKLLKNKKELEVVILRGHNNVTDAVVKLIVETSPNLQIVNLNETSISDVALFYLKDCKNLIDLSITKTRVTDEGMADFASGDAIKSLRFIRMVECMGLTNESLSHLIVPESNLCISRHDLAPGMAARELARLKKLHEDSAKKDSYV